MWNDHGAKLPRTLHVFTFNENNMALPDNLNLNVLVSQLQDNYGPEVFESFQQAASNGAVDLDKVVFLGDITFVDVQAAARMLNDWPEGIEVQGEQLHFGLARSLNSLADVITHYIESKSKETSRWIQLPSAPFDRPESNGKYLD